MKNVSYAQRSYHYMKSYGVTKLRRKVQERLYRNSLEKGYQNWMIKSRPAESEKELQRAHPFHYAPCISVVVPVYRTQEKYLREIVPAIEVRSMEEAAEAVTQMGQRMLEVKDLKGYEVRELVYSAAGLFLSQVEVKNRAEELKVFEEQSSLCGSMDQLLDQLAALQNRYVEEMRSKREADTVRPIRMAKQYIQNHYSEPITQEGVSSAVGLSAAYFSALFKKVEGEGFAKYLINVRMEQAKVLLRETNTPVAKICQQVGYNDLKHFTHTFEKVTGVKPSVYRKMYG